MSQMMSCHHVQHPSDRAGRPCPVRLSSTYSNGKLTTGSQNAMTGYAGKGKMQCQDHNAQCIVCKQLAPKPVLQMPTDNRCQSFMTIRGSAQPNAQRCKVVPEYMLKPLPKASNARHRSMQQHNCHHELSKQVSGTITQAEA